MHDPGFITHMLLKPPPMPGHVSVTAGLYPAYMQNRAASVQGNLSNVLASLRAPVFRSHMSLGWGNVTLQPATAAQVNFGNNVVVAGGQWQGDFQGVAMANGNIVVSSKPTDFFQPVRITTYTGFMQGGQPVVQSAVGVTGGSGSLYAIAGQDFSVTYAVHGIVPGLTTGSSEIVDGERISLSLSATFVVPDNQISAYLGSPNGAPVGILSPGNTYPLTLFINVAKGTPPYSYLISGSADPGISLTYPTQYPATPNSASTAIPVRVTLDPAMADTSSAQITFHVMYDSGSPATYSSQPPIAVKTLWYVVSPQAVYFIPGSVSEKPPYASSPITMDFRCSSAGYVSFDVTQVEFDDYGFMSTYPIDGQGHHLGFTFSGFSDPAVVGGINNRAFVGETLEGVDPRIAQNFAGIAGQPVTFNWFLTNNGHPPSTAENAFQALEHVQALNMAFVPPGN